MYEKVRGPKTIKDVTGKARGMGFYLPSQFDEEKELPDRLLPDLRDTTSSCEAERDPKALLSYAEATRLHPEIAVAESALLNGDLDLSSYQIFTRAPKSFRWMFHFSRNRMSMPLIDGDVASVYPCTTKEDMQNDVHCVAKYFGPDMHTELVEYLMRTLKADPPSPSANRYPNKDKDVFVWHSLPKYSFIVQVEFHKTLRYLSADGEVTCLQIGETRDVTTEMKQYEELVCGMLSRHRESIDHRLGNKIRMMHLLCQSSSIDELSTQFERLSYEIEIRRNMFSNLPPVNPITFEHFINQEFIKVRAKGLTRQRLLFYDLLDRPLSPVVIQVLILQDIASNALKHGDGEVHCSIDGCKLSISNNRGGVLCPGDRIFGTIGNQSSRKRIGLETLKTVCKSIDVNIEFDRQQKSFCTTLTFGKIKILPSEVCEEGCAPTSPPATNFLQRDPFDEALNYTWVILEDEQVICKLYKHLAKSKVSIDFHVIQSPAEVSVAAKIVVDLYRTHEKPVIVIMDEKLVAMDDNFRLSEISGTQIRNLFFNSGVVSDLIYQRKLILVSSSASDVEDDRVLLKLGKNGAVSADIARILTALRNANHIIG